MSDQRDRVDIEGIGDDAGEDRVPRDAKSAPRPFLMTWFRCCHAYGRLTRNAEGTRYEGRCPRCGTPVSARIGPGGTDRRMFEAR
ncbi:MAG: hypothetical protein VX726_00785 [Planctomycetota bacterium]|nr:hypothetical protein [Planctomycetota bacterium]